MDLKPTEQMAKNAERGLKLRKEFNRGGTEVGVARATQLKNRENLSPETVKRMVSYFARHAGDNLSETDPPSAGYIAWLLWGGDAGRDWAERKAKQIDQQKENEVKAIEQKKLAIIKSNAAPEVKLKALEVLSNGMLEDYHKMTKAYQTGDKKTALEMAQKLAQSGWKDSARMKDVQHVLKQLSNGYDNAKRLYDEGNYKGIQWRLFQTDYNPSPTKMIYTAQAMVTKDGKTLVSQEEFNPQEAVQDLKKKIDKHLAAQNSYKNADSKLDPAKLALSKMLDQLGYKAMAREVMQESDIQALKKYARVVISEFEKAKSPKADRVKALLGQLGVGV